MKIETLVKNSYCLTGPNKDSFSHFKCTRITRPTPEYTCWKWNRAYKVTFETEQDIDDAFAFNKTQDVLNNLQVLNFLSAKYFKGKELIMREYYSPHLYPYDNNFTAQYTYYVCLKEDAKELTNVLPKEQQEWDRKKAVSDNTKILKAFFKENALTICNKYGLAMYEYSEHNPNIAFKDKEAFIKFINNALKETVIKELSNIGLKVELDETILSKILKPVWNTGFDLLQDEGIIINYDKIKTALQ